MKKQTINLVTGASAALLLSAIVAVGYLQDEPAEAGKRATTGNSVTERQQAQRRASSIGTVAVMETTTR